MKLGVDEYYLAKLDYYTGADDNDDRALDVIETNAQAWSEWIADFYATEQGEGNDEKERNLYKWALDRPNEVWELLSEDSQRYVLDLIHESLDMDDGRDE